MGHVVVGKLSTYLPETPASGAPTLSLKNFLSKRTFEWERPVMMFRLCPVAYRSEKTQNSPNRFPVSVHPPENWLTTKIVFAECCRHVVYHWSKRCFPIFDVLTLLCASPMLSRGPLFLVCSTCPYSSSRISCAAWDRSCTNAAQLRLPTMEFFPGLASPTRACAK